MIINIYYNKSISNKLISNYTVFLNDYSNLQELKSFFTISEINSIKEIIIVMHLLDQKILLLIGMTKKINAEKA